MSKNSENEKDAISGGKLISVQNSAGNGSSPGFVFSGQKPAVGHIIRMAFDNAGTYEGKVAAVTTEGDEHLVEFDGDLKHVE